MVAIAEVPWEERLKVLDFSIIQSQIARERKIAIHEVPEVDVRERMQKLAHQDERARRLLYPQDRPTRRG